MYIYISVCISHFASVRPRFADPLIASFRTFYGVWLATNAAVCNRD